MVSKGVFSIRGMGLYTYMHTCIHALHYITLHYITFHFITLHYITLQYNTIQIQYITLHCITFMWYILYLYDMMHIYIYIFSYPWYPMSILHIGFTKFQLQHPVPSSKRSTALAYCPRSRQEPKEISPSSNSYSTCERAAGDGWSLGGNPMKNLSESPVRKGN